MKKQSGILKLIIVLLIVVLDIVVIKVVTKDDRNSSSSESLYERGLAMISSMNELASDENYRKMIGMPEQVESIINEIVDMDYSTPKQVYNISNVEELMNVTMYMSEVDENTFKGEAKEYIQRKYARTICNYIMGQCSGAMALATSSCFAKESVFVDNSVTEGMVYIYVYDNAYPVFVSFIPGEDGAVLASSSYLILDSMIGADTETAKQCMDLGLMHIELEEINE